jgi:site-specific DNA-methyltransferase (adenine-specific)
MGGFSQGVLSNREVARAALTTNVRAAPYSYRLMPSNKNSQTAYPSVFVEGRGFDLLLGNSIDLMNEMTAESVDMIFADPPYNLSNDGFTVHAGKRVSVNKGSWDKSDGVQEDFNFHFKWIEACKRVLKPNGTIWISGTYHSIYACGHALQLQDWRILNDITWYKPNAAPSLGCRMFTASHETLLWASKSKKAKHTFNYELLKNGAFPNDQIKKPGKQMRSVWAVGTPRQEEKVFGKHPTQKPLDLLLRIVLASTNLGDVVLDPFCGSATTGVAALQLDRRFIGIDADKTYLETLALPRLQAEQSQGKLGLYEAG